MKQLDLYSYYKNYYELTKLQNKNIINDEIDKIPILIEKKQKIIKQIKIKCDFNDYLKKQNEPKKAFSRLKTLMKEINKLEKVNTKKLKDKQNIIESKINELNDKKKSRKGYLSYDKSEAKFIDKKS